MKYRRKHNPFVSFTSITSDPSLCEKIVGASQFDTDLFAGHLPHYSYYVPNIENGGAEYVLEEILIYF